MFSVIFCLNNIAAIAYEWSFKARSGCLFCLVFSSSLWFVFSTLLSSVIWGKSFFILMTFLNYFFLLWFVYFETSKILLTKAHTGFFSWILFLSGRFMVKISTLAFWCILCPNLCARRVRVISPVSAHSSSTFEKPGFSLWPLWKFTGDVCVVPFLDSYRDFYLFLLVVLLIFFLLRSSKLCYLVHRHLGLLYLLYKFTPLSLWNDFIHGDSVLCLKCVLSDIEVATLALFNYF